MPLRDDLLAPIPGDNPSGAYLYYQPIYDKIKEARREDDDSGPSGVWARERKVADWNQVIKLAGDALATQTKDVQLAAWLAEAHLRKEGFGSFKAAIEFITQLLEQFWDTLYPEIEDGDSEFRATPLNWLGNFDLQLRMLPITKGGKSTVDYKYSRSLGTREAAEAEGGDKLEKYTTAVAEGKITAEDFDADFDKTSKQYYVDYEANLSGCLDAFERLNVIGEEKFGDYAPGYSKIRGSMEEVRNTIRILLARKREKEPDAPAPGEEPAEVEETAEEVAGENETETVSDAPVRSAKKKGGALAAEPVDLDDAIARMISAAKFVRQQDAYSPAPYLMLAGFRIGELRASGDTLDQSKLEAPPSELRQSLKRLSMEGNWLEVLNTAEQAAGLPCGRGWLDMHRYAARACSELGWYYDGLRKGIVGLVRALVADYPDLPKLTLMDDTPVANAETMQWLDNDVGTAAASGPAEQSYEPAIAPARHYEEQEDGVEAPPDAWELAQQAMRGGRVREAVELIDREAKMEQSGRGRFIRRTQLARIFIDSGNEPMAMPILEQIEAEIDSRGLENWEPSETIAQPLALLYRCLARSDKDGDATKKLYAKLCRLDPVAAMNVLR